MSVRRTRDEFSPSNQRRLRSRVPSCQPSTTSTHTSALPPTPSHSINWPAVHSRCTIRPPYRPSPDPRPRLTVHWSHTLQTSSHESCNHYRIATRVTLGHTNKPHTWFPWSSHRLDRHFWLFDTGRKDPRTPSLLTKGTLAVAVDHLSITTDSRSSFRVQNLIAFVRGRDTRGTRQPPARV